MNFVCISESKQYLIARKVNCCNYIFHT